MTDSKLKIIGLKASNIKRIEAVELQFDEKQNLIEITGANGEGKSSLIDCVKFLFASGRDIDAMPIREGENKAEIEVELNKYAPDGTVTDTGIIIKRTFTKSGTRVAITKQESLSDAGLTTQKLLDELYEAVSFDPLAFSELSKTPEGKKKQVETLKTLTGLSFDSLEAEYSKTFTERTDVNRTIEQYKAQLSGRTFDPALPTEEVLSSDLVQEIDTAMQSNSALSARKAALENISESIQTANKRAEDLRKELDSVLDGVRNSIAEKDRLATELKGANPIDVDALKEKLQGVEATNSSIRANKEVKQVKDIFDQKSKESEEKTKRLDGIKVEKEKMLKEAKMPIDGLTFNSDGILIEGIPFEQVNDADKLKTSTAIAMALNPVLRAITIKNASLLDKKNYDIIKEMAKDKDYTILMERVDESGEVGIVIEEGKVKVNNYDKK